MHHRSTRLVIVAAFVACVTLVGHMLVCQERSERELNRLFRACSDGDTEKVLELIDSGIPIDVREDNGETPLMYAAVNGHRETVQALAKRGADINAVSATGQTALARAALGRSSEVTEALIELGAD